MLFQVACTALKPCFSVVDADGSVKSYASYFTRSIQVDMVHSVLLSQFAHALVSQLTASCCTATHTYPHLFCFSIQGHHPFAYALAELIDNSLRATRKVVRFDQPRTITISFVTCGSGGARKGLICVRDNGSGMSKEALNDWAVMNLSMEDRGQQPTEAEPAGRGQPSLTGAGNFLTGDLSYFGVRLH